MNAQLASLRSQLATSEVERVRLETVARQAVARQKEMAASQKLAETAREEVQTEAAAQVMAATSEALRGQGLQFEAKLKEQQGIFDKASVIARGEIDRLEAVVGNLTRQVEDARGRAQKAAEAAQTFEQQLRLATEARDTAQTQFNNYKKLEPMRLAAAEGKAVRAGRAEMALLNVELERVKGQLRGVQSEKKEVEAELGDARRRADEQKQATADARKELAAVAAAARVDREKADDAADMVVVASAQAQRQVVNGLKAQIDDLNAKLEKAQRQAKIRNETYEADVAEQARMIATLRTRLEQKATVEPEATASSASTELAASSTATEPTPNSTSTERAVSGSSGGGAHRQPWPLHVRFRPARGFRNPNAF